jgi:hypothetical protein
MKFKAILSVLSLSVLLSSAYADDIRLGMAGYGGTGCPAGSASVTLSPDYKSLSLIFDSYVAEAGASSGRTLDRKTCSIAIPIYIPQGLSVSIIRIDYRGYVALPNSYASASFNSEYFFAGSTGPRFSKSWRGRTDTNYLFNNDLALSASVWSPCGESVNMRVNTSMLVRNSVYNSDALATVDSADFAAGIVYQLQWRRCGS